MEKLGKSGVALALSLILSMTLFTSGIFAYTVNLKTAPASAIGIQGVVRADAIHQDSGTRQISDPRINEQRTNTRQTTQRNDACSSAGNCQQSARCTRIFRSAWGWVYICNGW